MCGITGFWQIVGPPRPPQDMHACLERMTAALRHRGPDDSGIWVDTERRIGLGQHRLSIIDLSAAGHQPMANEETGSVLVYNGEIYNAAELRAELKHAGVSFRGHSDTEVVLSACVHWGVEAALARFNGMFAFALWDARRREVVLARDHVGIKPLFWGVVDGTLLFASELKALHGWTWWRPEVDRQTVSHFLEMLWVPASECIFKGIHKLRPGYLVRIGADGRARETRYWDLAQVIGDGITAPVTRDAAEADEMLNEALISAVDRQMVSDVPLGAFLSGGFDSSTVVALMQSRSSMPVKTFTIGYHDADYDEAHYAAAIARHLGTDHTELYVTPQDAMDVVPTLADVYDEPFADASQIPTVLVSKLARSRVTVSLSGDGGDELFAGYRRHLSAWRGWSPARRFPWWARKAIAGAMHATPEGLAQGVGRLIGHDNLPEALQSYGELLGHGDLDSYYHAMWRQWPRPPVTGAWDACWTPWWGDRRSLGNDPDVFDRAQYLDSIGYLPDDILTKLDRASMSVGLEARVPLLDKQVMELVWSLPRSWRVEDGVQKAPLRRILDRHVPAELTDRPKTGFHIPMGNWLRGDLRPWAEDLLSEESLNQSGFLDPAPIRALWQRHLESPLKRDAGLWGVLMFQQWWRRWMTPTADRQPKAVRSRRKMGPGTGSAERAVPT